MARYAYQRLHHDSAVLLARESSRQFAHTGMIAVFEPGPLGRPDGGVVFAAIRCAIESKLSELPHYRRKLRRIPIENHPVWVDDHEFNLDYHLRHTALPRPGGLSELRQVAARVQSQRLDRSRPLWECWVLEGLEGGRFALLVKTHLAMADTGADLLEALLSKNAAEPVAEPRPFVARPMPSAAELARDELLRQMRLPRQALRRTLRFFRETDHMSEEIQRRVRGLARLLGYSIRRLQETPLTGPLGPHRRCEYLTLPLEDAKLVRRELGGSIHDVVIATVTGAVARYLRAHHVNPSTLDFRAAVPVSLRSGTRRQGVGEWHIDLPVWETDPVRRLLRVREHTDALGKSSPPLGAAALTGEERWIGSRLLALGASAISHRRPEHMRIINVPGAQLPLYFAGARLDEAYGMVPLDDETGLGVAVLSYDGKLCVGLNADFDRVADLALFGEALVESFRELVREAQRRRARLSVVRAS
jgi:diacylglycerol O-acyltransferase / wax synthase